MQAQYDFVSPGGPGLPGDVGPGFPGGPFQLNELICKICKHMKLFIRVKDVLRCLIKYP